MHQRKYPRSQVEVLADQASTYPPMAKQSFITVKKGCAQLALAKKLWGKVQFD
jgi:hypothetical protein